MGFVETLTPDVLIGQNERLAVILLSYYPYFLKSSFR